MLGDKLLAGQFEVSVDDKSRIFLPTKTGREQGDLVFILYDALMEHYKLYSAGALEKIFEHYNRLIVEAKTEEEKINYKREHLKFCKSILKEVSVDAQGRMTLNPVVQPAEKISLIGAGDHLILERKKDHN